MQVSRTRRMLWRKPLQVNSLRRLGRASRPRLTSTATAIGSSLRLMPGVGLDHAYHYPTCYYDVTGLASIWTCTSARCSEVSARDSIYSKYTTCPERRQKSWVWSCNPFDWHETPTLPKNYERINYDRWGAYDATLEYVRAYVDEHESWETTPPALGKGRLQVGLYCTDVLLPTRMMTAKRCTWACVNAPADIDFDNG